MGTTEVWLPVAGFEGAYEVSDLGRVRSLPGGHRHVKVLATSHAGAGYLCVSPCLDGAPRKSYVHHLVAAAFLGPRPAGMHICHGNGDPEDNRASNLRYDSVSANSRDAVQHQTHNESTRTHCDHGHELTPDNTLTQSNGVAADGVRKYRRRCRTCARAKAAIWNETVRQRKAATPAP